MDVGTIIFLIRILQIILLLGAIVLAVFVSSQIYVLSVREAPWVPTRRDPAHHLLSFAKLKKGETVLDMGCGDGSILITGAREFGARGIGYDINPMIILLGRVRCLFSGVVSQVHLKRGNIFHVEIPRVDVVALYLFPQVNSALLPRLKAGLPAGTRVVTRAFPIQELTPKETSVFNKETYYLYEL